MKKKIYFYLLLFLSVVTLFCTWVKFENKNYINVILETKIENNDDILLKIDNEYFYFKQLNNVLNQTVKKKFDNAEILINSKHKKEIKKIVVFNDIKMHIYSDFSGFNKQKEKLCDNKICKEYNKYELKKEIIKPDKFKKIYSFLNSISQFDKIFYPFFILISLTIFYGYKLKLNKFILPICILFLAIILRLSNINTFEPWGDECYSIAISSPNLAFSNLYNDPGNPPFYYFLLRIVQNFSNSILSFRLLSFIFSILGGVILYSFLYKKYSNKIATIAFFLYAINLPLIYFSQEIRSYSLQIFLSILILIHILKLSENSNIKNWVVYGILLVISINTHYYQIIFAFTNFLYLFYIFAKNKRKKDIILLFCIYIIAFSTFLPYYIITAHKKALLDTNFNSYIEPLNLNLIKKYIFYIFSGIVPLILTIIFWFKKPKLNLKNKEHYNYYFWTIVSVLFVAIMLSLILRPIYAKHYALFLIPFILIILSTIFSYEYKNKWLILLFAFCILAMQNYSKNSFINLRYVTANNYNVFKLAQKTKNNDNNIIVITKASDIFIQKLNNYTEFKMIPIPNKLISYDYIKKYIEKLKKEDKKVIIFTLLVEHNLVNIENKNYTCYFNSSRDLCIWKIE